MTRTPATSPFAQFRAQLLAHATARGYQCTPVLGARFHTIIERGTQRFLLASHHIGLNLAIAVRSAKDKHVTKQLLAHDGIATPAGVCVDSEAACVAAYNAHPSYTVLKPRHGAFGRGVAVGIRDAVSLRAAYAAAGEPSCILEEEVRGDDMRVLVIDGVAVAASIRRPPEVAGDGERSVTALIDAWEAERERVLESWATVRRVLRDAHMDAVLAEQGLERASIPERGCRIQLRKNANLSTGGIALAANPVPPLLADLAVRAARALQLRIAGVDLLVQDAAAGSAVVLEVNGTPGYANHVRPDVGAPVDVIAPLLDACDRTPPLPSRA